MRKTIWITLAVLFAFFSFFYFEAPLNLLRPVFHTEEVNLYAGKYGVDPLLVTALIKVESNFFRRARSHRGAVGLMQLLPSTAEELARELGYRSHGSADLEDPRINIHLGTFYLAKLKKEFNGNDILALAAYNAGKNKVQSWYHQNPLLGFETVDIPYPETRDYVRSVTRTYEWLKKIQTFKKLIRGKTR